MNNFRKTIHSKEHEQLRAMLKQQRETLGLTQRALAERMGVIYSLIGKVETGDRRLDVIEFIGVTPEFGENSTLRKLFEF